MNNWDLNKLFKVFIENEVVTDSTLRANGITNNNIQEFINIDIISKIGNVYILKRKACGELFSYGLNQLKNNNNRIAFGCFKLCLGLNPEHTQSRKFKLIAAVKIKDYEEALKYFKEKPIDKWSKHDYFYLYMLSQITNLPEEYLTIARRYQISFSKGKIRLENDKYKEVKHLSMNYRYTAALRETSKLIGEEVITPTNYFIHSLLSQARESISINTIQQFLTNERVEEGIILMREYLFRLRRPDYDELIRCFIQLGEQTDKNYEMPLDILANLENNERVGINTKDLEDRFNNALERNVNYEANIIFRAFREIDRLGIQQIDVENFSKRLRHQI